MLIPLASGISRFNSMQAAEWLGSITGIIGALLLALNFEGSGYAYGLFLASNFCLIPFFIRHHNYGLLTKELIFTVIDVLGIIMWLA